MTESFSFLLLSGYLAVVTIPPGARVQLDGRAVGSTPLVTEVTAGSTRVSVVKEWGGSFFRAETTTTVTVTEQDTTWLALAWAAPLYVDSDPQGAQVAIGGKPSGFTPTVLSGLVPGAGRLTVSHPCCYDSTAAVSLSPLYPQRVAFHLRPHPVEAITRTPGLVGPAAGALVSVASGLAAWVVHEEADRAYGDYLSAADPNEIRSTYNRTQRLDRAAAGLWALSLSSFLGTLLWWTIAG
jgi:hypothetical protein